MQFVNNYLAAAKWGINGRASFKMFNFEVCAYLFDIKSKIPDFEPVDKSRSSGTQISDKRGRFGIGSE